MYIRSLIPLSMIFTVCRGEERPTMLFSDHIIAGRTLEDVYGAVESLEDMTPFHQRPSSKDMRFSGDYLKHRSQENCDFPIELVVLQDATSSFNDDILNMKETQLQLMIDALSTSHPGSAYATISFRDKPLWPLGEVGDYCVRFESSLSLDSSTVIADYAKLVISGGGDPPEASFTALVASTQSNTPGWGLVPSATRLIVVVTDAAPHFDEDGFNVFNLPPFSGVFDEANNDQQCVEQYYPGPATVKQALQGRQVYLASLVYDGSYDSHLPIESWKWFNSYINQSEAFVFDIEKDSSNFWTQLSQIITELEEVECGLSSTPPPEVPTTTIPETTTTPVMTTVAPDTITTPAPSTAPETALTSPGTITIAPVTVTPIGTVEVPSTEEECPPCPPCESAPCDPCCPSGVMIKLGYQPAKLHLDVEK